MSKIKNIIGWVLSGLAGLVLTYSIYGKFFVPGMDANMAKYGLDGWTQIIGLGELTATVLFLVPKTSRFGMLLLSSHMGGAIVVHMTQGEPFILQSAVLVFIWIGGILRNERVYEI